MALETGAAAAPPCVIWLIRPSPPPPPAPAAAFLPGDGILPPLVPLKIPLIPVPSDVAVATRPVIPRSRNDGRKDEISLVSDVSLTAACVSTTARASAVAAVRPLFFLLGDPSRVAMTVSLETVPEAAGFLSSPSSAVHVGLAIAAAAALLPLPPSSPPIVLVPRPSKPKKLNREADGANAVCTKRFESVWVELASSGGST
mmetsp:Transcript_23921/g.68723  ORF Transcript_23921/g.68723 Transcript_23921/m.68723 type:complete len:201 (+) Transcript_23921:353-955(+)